MGVSITSKNPKYTFDMGYIGFSELRNNIALALDKDFGENYAKLVYQIAHGSRQGKSKPNAG